MLKLAFWKYLHYIGIAGKSSLEKIVSWVLFPFWTVAYGQQQQESDHMSALHAKRKFD